MKIHSQNAVDTCTESPVESFGEDSEVQNHDETWNFVTYRKKISVRSSPPPDRSILERPHICLTTFLSLEILFLFDIEEFKLGGDHCTQR